MDGSSIHNASSTPPQSALSENLNQRQLDGLKFMGEIGARLADAWRPEFARPLTAAVEQMGTFYERHDLSGLLEDLLSVAAALRDSGLLDKLRANAFFISESWEQVQLLLPSVLLRMQQIPWEKLQQEMTGLQALIGKAHAIGEFYEKNMAAQLTEGLTELGAVWQETSLDAAALDAARTLGALHRDGTFGRIRDISALLSAVMQNSDLNGLAEGTVKGLESLSGVAQLPTLLKTMSELARAWQQSGAEVAEPEAAKGGLIGLIKLMRDPVVQEFLQRIIVTAQHMEHPAVPVPNGTLRH